MYRNKDGLPVLQGDGTFGFEVVVDGEDLVVRNVRCTWFGGPHDPDDDGHTSSGVNTKTQPDIDGCSLPMDGFGRRSTDGSPLPRLPWRTTVRVFNRERQATIEVPLIDLGPSKRKDGAPQGAIDLTPHAFAALGGTRQDGDVQVDFRVLGGAASLPETAMAQLKALPAPGEPVAFAATAVATSTPPYRVAWLLGDYVDHHDRQEQAASAGCALAIDFHFNSNGPTSHGAEVWHKADDDVSYRFALALKDVYEKVGLSPRNPAVIAAEANTRAGFIRHYPCPAVLLEPLFVSNPDEAKWIHQTSHLVELGESLAAAIMASFPPGSLIGLSVGHIHKRKPGDDSSACCLGDTEATHAAQLAQVVAAALTQPVAVKAKDVV